MLLLLGGASMAFADPQLAMSTISPEELSTKISQLDALRKNESLSEDEKEQLDLLWKNAAAIEQMNDRCGSISLTEEMDDDCGRFYQYELPEFETEFFKITGEIRLSPTRLSNAIEQRRNAITQCYEALQIDAFHPSRYLSLEGRYTPEPLTQGIEVSYDFTLEQNSNALTQLRDRMRQWNSVCGSIVLHSDNSGKLAPVFKDLIEHSRENAENVNGGLYFDVGRSGYNQAYILVKSKTGIYGTYYLNGAELFQHAIQSGEIIFEISVGNGSSQIRLNQSNHWRDKAFFSDEDVAAGLVGRFVWQTPALSAFFGNSGSRNAKKSSASYAPSNTKFNGNLNYDDEENAPKAVRGGSKSNSGMDWALQVIGGINLSMDKVKGAAAENFGMSEARTGENDSLTLFTPMVGGLFSLEFRPDIAFAVGGGVAWHQMNYSSCGEYSNCEEENVFLHVSPMAQAEFAFGYEVIGGTRFTYVFDSDAPTFYLGGFVELANLIGIELGWVHAENIWNNFYLGLYAKLPPKHFSERLSKVNSNK